MCTAFFPWEEVTSDAEAPTAGLQSLRPASNRPAALPVVLTSGAEMRRFVCSGLGSLQSF